MQYRGCLYKIKRYPLLTMCRDFKSFPSPHYKINPHSLLPSILVKISHHRITESFEKFMEGGREEGGGVGLCRHTVKVFSSDF